MTDESHFHFHLLRIAVAQILKSAGFDRCAPSTLNLVTDLYIRHLRLVLRESLKLLELSHRGQDLEVQDVAQAFVHTGLIKPVTLLDPYDRIYERETSIDLDTNTYNDGMKLFLDWVVGVVPERARTLSRATKEMVAVAKHVTPGLANGGLRENPHNPLRPISSFANPSASLPDGAYGTDHMSKTPAPAEDDEPVDWLSYLVMKQSGKLAEEMRFHGTVLERFEKHTDEDDETSDDFIILGETPESLIECLPYTQNAEDD